ncbi:MAG: NAD(P)H-hydrate epimerase [Nanoarchaeota archaeon]
MITSRQMKELEESAYEQGISPQQLMETAGEQVHRTIKQHYELANRRVIIFAGPGNNGGDGFVAARYFAEEHSAQESQLLPVLILFFGDKRKLSEEALEMYEKVRKKANIIPIHSPAELQKFHVQEGFPLLLIDALLGTGMKGRIREPLASAITYFNALPGIKVAVDIPSGLDPDTGGKNGECCDVDLIVTFHEVKVGLAGLPELLEKTVVVDIGIPKRLS